MDNKAQVSLEYLTMVAIALMIVAVASMLTLQLFRVKTDIRSTIELYREKMIKIS